MADRYANSNIMRGPALSGIEERAQHFVGLCTDATGGVLDIYVSGDGSRKVQRGPSTNFVSLLLFRLSSQLGQYDAMVASRTPA